MNFRRFLLHVLPLVVVFAIALPARSTGPPPQNPQLGSIGVKIASRGPTPISAPSQAYMVAFVKVDDEDGALHADNVIYSNLTHKKQVYLLNAEPGRYVAVKGAFDNPHFTNVPSFEAYFSQEMIPQTEVEVKAGELAFMGDIVVKISTGMKNPDLAQSHYLDLSPPDEVYTGKAAVSGEMALPLPHKKVKAKLKSRDTGADAEREFWSCAADETFAEWPSWRKSIKVKLDDALAD